MKKISLVLFLLLTLSTSILPCFAEQTYSEMLLEKKYHKAISKGCDDVIVKKTSTAGLLGFLPGGGAFYTREIAWGVVDLLTWPFSIIWDPAVSVKRAKEINYKETIMRCEAKKNIRL